MLLDKLINPEFASKSGYVAGEWRSLSKDGQTFEVVNPATGETLIALPDMGIRETREAIDVASSVQPAWAARTAKERANVLKRFFDLLIDNADDLATLITAEMGKPWTEARGEVAYGAAYVEWFAEEAKRVYGDVIPSHALDKRLLVTHQPIGVVGAITPWNFPVAMIARKIAPALAAGCAVVLKPSDLTPLSALALARIAEHAGVPPGLLSVLTTTDGVTVGKELCANPKVRKITFTGSTPVGRALMAQSSETIKKLSLELGGNAPFIVFEDADIDIAVREGVAAKFRNNGQTCVCVNRFLVHESIAEEFAEKLSVAVAALKTGDGFSRDVDLGPMVSAAALRKVEEHIADAVKNGGHIVRGGTRQDGLFFAPTVIKNASTKMKLHREETFGPVAAIFPFRDNNEALTLANDTDAGLAAYLFTNNLSRIWRVSEGLEYGMVGINTGFISTEVAPFGGIKNSGIGREGGRDGIFDYLETKYLCLGEI